MIIKSGDRKRVRFQRSNNLDLGFPRWRSSRFLPTKGFWSQSSSPLPTPERSLHLIPNIRDRHPLHAHSRHSLRNACFLLRLAALAALRVCRLT